MVDDSYGCWGRMVIVLWTLKVIWRGVAGYECSVLWGGVPVEVAWPLHSQKGPHT